ncbi:MAG: Sap, sulfolipid-addressing protein [Actinomycetota bacterium]
MPHGGNVAQLTLWQARTVLALLGVVVSVAFADSINPSTVGPALYLASGRDAGRGLLAFIAGVFGVSAAAGVVLVVGPGQALVPPHPHPHAEHLVEAGAGVALVVLAGVLWLARTRVARRVIRNERSLEGRTILVGAGIMAVELPTALPYFAVLAAVTGSGRALATQIALVLLFNLVFVAPLLGVLAICRLAGTRGRDWLSGARRRVDEHAEGIVPGLVLLVGLALLALGTTGLAGD